MTTLPPHLAHLARGDEPQEGPETEPTPELAHDLGDDPLEALMALRARREPCALCTVVANAGSSPRKLGAKMLVLPDGSFVGTIGGGAIEQHIISAARGAIESGIPELVERHLTHDLGMCCGGKMRVFVDPQGYAPRLLLFGAGHVAAPIARVATTAGFDVEVFDARPEWANAERFPDARVVCAPFEDSRPELETDADTYVVVVTHDHGLDQQICESFLRSPHAYLGVIGSVRKREKFRSRMRSAGFSEEEVLRMRTPMGLDIGAVTPEEIAVSVVAELIAVRRGKADGATGSMSELGKGYKPKKHEAG